jgi:glutamyl-Q tRNA(Asp) synthetase
MSKRPVFRFAPSPNGSLHLGHALSALVGYQWARAAGGRFLLRIEDIDKGRSRPEFVAAIFEDLAWLGLAWEQPVVFQSLRMDAYRAAARRLEALRLLYPCFATRTEIEAAARDGGRDPDGVRRSTPAYGRAAPKPRSHDCGRRARRTPSASTWRRRFRRPWRGSAALP